MSASRRLDGWDSRLAALVLEARRRPFEWGRHDCSTFAVADFVAMMGAAPIGVPVWDSLLAAQRNLKIRPLADWATMFFGEPVETWKRGRRGDIALVNCRPGCEAAEVVDALGVIIGNNIACPGVSGLEFAPLPTARRVWLIG